MRRKADGTYEFTGDDEMTVNDAIKELTGLRDRGHGAAPLTLLDGSPVVAFTWDPDDDDGAIVACDAEALEEVREMAEGDEDDGGEP